MLPDLSHRSALLVGVGGLGCPVAWLLAQAGIGRLVLMDDDVVDESNLHRQVLFSPRDIGQPKLQAARRALTERGFDSSRIECIPTRLLPDNARRAIASVDLVVEGADNYATKFLAADAARLERRPIVHGSAVGWHGTAWTVCGSAGPCLRCLFEDLPSGQVANCNTLGVMGPVVGMVGALMAELALGVLTDQPRFGCLSTYDGLTDRLRQVEVSRRSSCPLCGVRPEIFEIQEQRYTRQICAA